jgi:hypothetical protein
MFSIWSGLAKRPDPRSGNARRHDLLDVLTIALTASPMPGRLRRCGSLPFPQGGLWRRFQRLKAKRRACRPVAVALTFAQSSCSVRHVGRKT